MKKGIKLEKKIEDLKICNWRDMAKDDMNILLKYNLRASIDAHYTKEGCLDCDGLNTKCMSYWRKQ